MANRNEGSERRGHKRFRLQEGGVAFLTPPGPHSSTVGNIIDISMSGLSFLYIADEALPNGTSELTVTSPEDGFYLRKLPTRSISDFEIAKTPFGSMAPRRLCLKFGDLTQNQTSDLQCFIMTHATGEVWGEGSP